MCYNAICNEHAAPKYPLGTAATESTRVIRRKCCCWFQRIISHQPRRTQPPLLSNIAAQHGTNYSASRAPTAGPQRHHVRGSMVGIAWYWTSVWCYVALMTLIKDGMKSLTTSKVDRVASCVIVLATCAGKEPSTSGQRRLFVFMYGQDHYRTGKKDVSKLFLKGVDHTAGRL